MSGTASGSIARRRQSWRAPICLANGGQFDGPDSRGYVAGFNTGFATTECDACADSELNCCGSASGKESLLDRKDEHRCVFGAVPERVLADLVRLIVVRPQDIGNGRVAVDDFQADAIALLELESVGLDADIEAVHLARLERLRLVVRPVGFHLRRAALVDGAMRRAQPALRHDLESGVDALRALVRRLRELLRELDDEVGIASRG